MNYRFLMDLADWLDRTAELARNEQWVAGDLNDKAIDLRAEAMVLTARQNPAPNSRNDSGGEAA